MAVLELKPTRAPNLTGTSQILAQAGLSLDRGFEAAGGVLASYQAGQEAKADDEVFAEISGLKNREEIAAWFEGGGLRGKRISADMKERVSALYADAAGLASTRATTASTLASTGIRKAVEVDRAAEEVDRIAARAELRGLTPGFIAGTEEGREFGLTGTGAAPVVAPTGAPTATVPPGGAAAALEASVPVIPGAAPTPAVSAPPAGTIEPWVSSSGERVWIDENGWLMEPEIAATHEAAFVEKARTPAPTALPSYKTKTETESGFMTVIADKVRNPFALAAIAATGQHESAFTAENASGTWKDGKRRAGGVMSWNGDRLAAMQKFTGDDKSPEAQAAFFLQEDPALMAALEKATSVEEAVTLMNNAWRFAGYDKAGGEAAARLETARAIYGTGPTPDGATIETSAIPAPGADPLDALRAIGNPAGLGVRSPTGGRSPEEALAEAEAAGIPPLSASTTTPPAASTIAAAVPDVATLVADPNQFRDALITSVAATKFMTPAQADQILAGSRAATAEGEAENLRLEAIARMEHLTAVATEWAQDPNTDMKLETLQKLLSAQPGTAVEKLQAGLFALEVGNGALKSVISPSYIKDPSVERGITEELERNRRSLKIQDIHRVLNNAKLFGDDDPAKGLEEYLELKGDKHAGGGTYLWGIFGEEAGDTNALRNLIQHVANASGVSDAEAAAAMADRFERDPSGINVLEHRFDKHGTIAYLKATLTEDARRAYEGDVERVARREDELNSGGVRLSVLRRQQQKMTDANSTPEERKNMAQAIASLQGTLRAGRTPVEGRAALADYIGEGGMGIASYLKSLDPGSERHKEAVEFIRLSIEGDAKLSDAHKRLLFAAIKS